MPRSAHNKAELRHKSTENAISISVKLCVYVSTFADAMHITVKSYVTKSIHSIQSVIQCIPHLIGSSAAAAARFGEGNTGSDFLRSTVPPSTSTTASPVCRTDTALAVTPCAPSS